VWFVDFGQSFPSLLVLRDRNLLLRKLRYPTVNRHINLWLPEVCNLYEILIIERCWDIVGNYATPQLFIDTNIHVKQIKKYTNNIFIIRHIWKVYLHER
jgi:hypothetical protein